MAKAKKSAPTIVEVIQSLAGENQMHDDHGPVIIGRRDRKPTLPAEEVKTEN
jgi:hypothetical protein